MNIFLAAPEAASMTGLGTKRTHSIGCCDVNN
jgi:hypothetical protein